MMRSNAFSFISIAIASSAIVQAAHQFSVVNGVLGGVPDIPSKLGAASKTPPSVLVTTPGKLRVTENSGICETTPGIYQASGYGDLTSTESMWFWFFQSRTKSDSAPLTLWFNGGPGSSSMIGLSQENGPCRILNNSDTVSLNPNSWNTASHTLFIDQPIGTGFSHGDTTVGTSLGAAKDVWSFMQIFFKDTRFSKYVNNTLAIWTESYGGHYGPNIANYFLTQNAAIRAGSINGVIINLKVLGIGNGLTDPATMYPAYIQYSAYNPYHQLVSSSTIKSANTTYLKSGGCRDQINSCNNGGSDSVCSRAQSYCNEYILSPLGGNWDVYYVPAANPDPYPRDPTDWLNSVASQIGAEVTWKESSRAVYNHFAATGDWMRTSKALLQSVMDAGVRTFLYDGDADYICNYMGVEGLVASLALTPSFNSQPFTPYTVNGIQAGIYKTSNKGMFSYLRVSQAGHEVPSYKINGLGVGQAALQFFNQVTLGQNLAST